MRPSAAQELNIAGFSDYMEAAADLSRALDHEQFDLEALSFAMAVELPEAIAARVDGLIATQVYAGALRGAEGTLRAGAGNSLDQALLLHRLLIDAGQEARIARTGLSEDEALRLIATAGPSSRPPPLADGPGGTAALARMEQAAGQPGLLQPLSDMLTGNLPAPEAPDFILAEAERLGAALGDAMPDGRALDARLLEEARDYFWVQTRLFGGDDWQDMHIAFTPAAPLAADSFVPLPLADDLQHWVKLDFELEIRDQDKLKSEALMEGVWVSAIDLPARPYVLSVLPDGMLKGEDSAIAATADTTFYFPLLNGELPPRALAFTAQGLTAPAADVLLSGGMASVVAAGAAKVSAAGGLIAGLGGSSEAEMPPNTPMRDITGLWAVITTQAPGGERTTYRRPLFDRIGPDLRAEGGVFVPEGAAPAEIAVLGQWMVMAMTGGVGEAQVVAGQIDRTLQMAPMVMAADDRMAGLPVANPAMQALMTSMFDTAAQAGALGQGGWTYRAAPGILIASQTYRQDGETALQRSGIDILTTGRRAIGEGGKALPMAALGAGVAETLAERVMADGIAVNLGRAPVATPGSWGILTAAEDLTPVRRPGDIPELSPGTRAAMEAELKLGRVLALAGGDTAAWWRVDPTTGATIGVDALGGGQESADYVTMLDAVVTYGFAAYGTESCRAAGGDFGCCFAVNFAWGAVGFSIWGVAGAALEKFTRLTAAAAAGIGLAGGAATSATGWNPYGGLCQ